MPFGFAADNVPPHYQWRLHVSRIANKTRDVLREVEKIKFEEKPNAHRKCVACGYAWMWHSTLKRGWRLKRGIVLCRKFKEAV